MSAEILRVVASSIRADYSDRSQAGFENAVADFLEEEADYMETTPRHKHDLPSTVSALAIAHAYLTDTQ